MSMEQVDRWAIFLLTIAGTSIIWAAGATWILQTTVERERAACAAQIDCNSKGQVPAIIDGRRRCVTITEGQ